MTNIRVAVNADDILPPDRARALLFDWDGTLFINHDFNYRAMAAGLSAVGVSLDETWFFEHSGFSARAIAQQAASDAGVGVDVAEVLDGRNRWAEGRLDEVIPNTATLRLLRNARPRKTAIVTGSERSTIDGLIGYHALAPHIDTVVTRDELSRGKPDPEGYLLALARLGVQPAEGIAYEDSDQGVAAAQAAGLDVIDVRHLDHRLS